LLFSDDSGSITANCSGGILSLIIILMIIPIMICCIKQTKANADLKVTCKRTEGSFKVTLIDHPPPSLCDKENTIGDGTRDKPVTIEDQNSFSRGQESTISTIDSEDIITPSSPCDTPKLNEGLTSLHAHQPSELSTKMIEEAPTENIPTTDHKTITDSISDVIITPNPSYNTAKLNGLLTESYAHCSQPYGSESSTDEMTKERTPQHQTVDTGRKECNNALYAVSAECNNELYISSDVLMCSNPSYRTKILTKTTSESSYDYIPPETYESSFHEYSLIDSVVVGVESATDTDDPSSNVVIHPNPSYNSQTTVHKRQMANNSAPYSVIPYRLHHYGKKTARLQHGTTTDIVKSPKGSLPEDSGEYTKIDDLELSNLEESYPYSSIHI